MEEIRTSKANEKPNPITIANHGLYSQSANRATGQRSPRLSPDAQKRPQQHNPYAFADSAKSKKPAKKKKTN